MVRCLRHFVDRKDQRDLSLFLIGLRFCPPYDDTVSRLISSFLFLSTPASGQSILLVPGLAVSFFQECFLRDF